MSRTRHIQQLWTYKFAQGRKTIETTKIKKNYQKMCKNARVLLFEVTLGGGGGVEAEFFVFSTLKIGTVLKFCTVIETHSSDNLKKKVAKSIAN